MPLIPLSVRHISSTRDRVLAQLGGSVHKSDIEERFYVGARPRVSDIVALGHIQATVLFTQVRIEALLLRELEVIR